MTFDDLLQFVLPLDKKMENLGCATRFAVYIFACSEKTSDAFVLKGG